MIRVLIVDDEPPARRKLRKFLEEESDIEVAGEASSGGDAVEAIKKLAPDAVFLDIQMPEMGGFEVLQHLDPARAPAIVFVTAYDQFALRAFEVAALDYLLKPYDRPRLRRSLERLRRSLSREPAQGLQERLERLLEEVRGEKGYARRILVKSQGRILFLSVEEIDWIEAAANYAELHVGARSHLLRDTMANLEKRLDPRRFVRVHRSAIVNVDRIREVHPYAKNDYMIVLDNGRKIRMSRRYKDRLEQAADLR